MSNLLKVKVGGSDYLCKWGKPYLYKTDFSKFDINTLKDGNVQWGTLNRAPTLTKQDNKLIINFSSGQKQYLHLNLEQFNISNIKKYVFECTYDGTLPYRSFFGVANCSLRGQYNNCDGIWKYYNNTWTHVFQTSIQLPVTCKMIVTQNENDNTAEIYLNDNFIGTTNFTKSYSLTHNVDLNGYSNDGTIIISNLSIKEIS